jgi:flagellar motor switch protein FliM
MSDDGFDDFELPEPPVGKIDEFDKFDQAGIDALFGGGGPVQSTRSGLRAVIESEVINHERLPMLEVVCERMVRAFSTSMRNLTSDSIEVSLDDVTTARFGDFMDRVTLPAMIAVVLVPEWENYGLMTIDSSLIYAVVDALLGGRKTQEVLIDGRDYTTIETALVSRMLNLAVEEFSAALAPLAPVTMKVERIETNPRFAAIARPSNIAAVCTFRVDIDGRGGRFSFVLPYATLEPVRDKLIQRFMGEKLGRENIWQTHMREQMLATEVDVEVILGCTELTLSSVKSLEVGQTLPFFTQPDEPMTLQCGGVELALAHAGQRRRHVAISLVSEIGKGGRA